MAGLVESTRGAAGGYALARPAGRITVWDAIRALDESFLPATSCGCDPEDRLDCRRTTGCAVASLWRRLGDEIRSSLSAVSLASLCDGASLSREESREASRESPPDPGAERIELRLASAGPEASPARATRSAASRRTNANLHAILERSP